MALLPLVNVWRGPGSCLAETTKGTVSDSQKSRRFKNPLFKTMLVLEIAL
jgi:hypothetical protein